jgi:hypothetical protein
VSVHPNGYVVAGASALLFLGFIGLLLWRSRGLHAHLTRDSQEEK